MWNILMKMTMDDLAFVVMAHLGIVKIKYRKKYTILRVLNVFGDLNT